MVRIWVKCATMNIYILQWISCLACSRVCLHFPLNRYKVVSVFVQWVCVCVCVFVHLYLHVCAYVCTCVYALACLTACARVYVSVCTLAFSSKDFSSFSRYSTLATQSPVSERLLSASIKPSKDNLTWMREQGRAGEARSKKIKKSPLAATKMSQ